MFIYASYAYEGCICLYDAAYFSRGRDVDGTLCPYRKREEERAGGQGGGVERGLLREGILLLLFNRTMYKVLCIHTRVTPVDWYRVYAHHTRVIPVDWYRVYAYHTRVIPVDWYRVYAYHTRVIPGWYRVFLLGQIIRISIPLRRAGRTWGP